MVGLKFPKDAYRRRRRALAEQRIAIERKRKRQVHIRDRWCRWPHCTCRETGGPWAQLEVAHISHKGMGGDPLMVRSQVPLMLLLCRNWHRGPYGIDSKQAKVIPLTPKGTSGLCEFWRRGKDGVWWLAGTTAPPPHDPDFRRRW